MARLREFYNDTVIKSLSKEFNYKSPMQVPRIEKITLNMGVGEAVGDKKVLEHAVADMEKMAGQNLLLQKQKNQLQLSKFVMIILSDAR